MLTERTNDLLFSSRSNTYFAINFCTCLFLLGGFINNRKTSSGAILFSDIPHHFHTWGPPPTPQELVLLLSTFRTLRAQGLKPNKGKGKV